MLKDYTMPFYYFLFIPENKSTDNKKKYRTIY